MDPNAALERIREITRGYNDPDSEDFNGVPGVDDLVDYAQQLTELVDGLDEWLAKGGFLPDAWQEQRKKDDMRECPSCGDIKSTSVLADDQSFVMLAKHANAADGLQAAIELGYPHFSHLANDYPIYKKEPREV